MNASRTFPLLFFTTCMLMTGQNRRNIHPDDVNRDGRISRDEWRGSAAEFRQLDTNRDGVLSGTEIPQDRMNTTDDRSTRVQGNRLTTGGSFS